jgi:hypothetical protein
MAQNMNSLKWTLVEKVGADKGLEYVLENGPDVVQIASTRHPVGQKIIDRELFIARYELRFS